MKLKNHALAIFAILLLGISTIISGCATTGLDRSIKTSNSIQDVDSDITKIITQIDVTSTSLDAVVKAEPANLKKTFDTYSDNLSKLDNQGKTVLKRLEAMKSSRKEYFTEWQKQNETYTNPAIKEMGEQRRAKLAETFSQVGIAGAGIKDTYAAYLTDLKEIRTYLSNDLTPAGVKTIEPVLTKTAQDLAALKQSLVPVTTALGTIKSQLYGGAK